MSIFIAEVKTKSPFGYKSKHSWNDLFEIAKAHGDWISIHVDPRWGGNLIDIKIARDMTEKPILAKGYHHTDKEIEQSLKAGANYVHVIGRVPSPKLLPFCLLEPKTVDEMANYPIDAKVVWNSRDLDRYGLLKAEKYETARASRQGWFCQAGHIKHPLDVYTDANAFIVGENLEAYVYAHRTFRKD